MRCSDIMRPVPTCDSGSAAQDCARLMRAAGADVVVLTDGGRIVGTAGWREIALAALEPGGPFPDALRELADGDFVSCGPEDDLAAARVRLAAADSRVALVLSPRGDCLGSLDQGDIDRADRLRCEALMRRALARCRIHAVMGRAGTWIMGADPASILECGLADSTA